LVHPELEQYHQQFERITAEAQALAAGLSEASFNWRPDPSTWSIQECLSHLVMVGQVEANAVEQAIDLARVKGLTGSGPYEYPVWERFILRETEPPVPPHGGAQTVCPRPRPAPDGHPADIPPRAEALSDSD
jgi:hypothetical protein